MTIIFKRGSIRGSSFQSMPFMEKQLKQAFSKIKMEIDDHKQAINENTNEIQSNYEYLCKVEAKLDRLSQTVEELTLFVHQLTKSNQQNQQQAEHSEEFADGEQNNQVIHTIY